MQLSQPQAQVPSSCFTLETSQLSQIVNWIHHIHNMTILVDKTCASKNMKDGYEKHIYYFAIVPSPQVFTIVFPPSLPKICALFEDTKLHPNIYLSCIKVYIFILLFIHDMDLLIYLAILCIQKDFNLIFLFTLIFGIRKKFVCIHGFHSCELIQIGY